MARLILQTAEGQQAIDLRPVNSLGRHPNNSIQLLDKIVSKEHCIVELRGDHFVLRDLGSLNGTFVNNERVRGEAPLKHGDEILLGSTRGRFEDGHVGAAPQPPAPAPWGAPQPAQQGPSPLAQSAQMAQLGQPAPVGAPQQGYPQAGYPQAGYPQPGYGQQPPSTQHGLGPGRVATPYNMGAPASGVPSHQASAPPVPPPMMGQPGPGYRPGQPPHQPGYPQAAGGFGTRPLTPPGVNTSFLAQGTRIDVKEQAQQIGTQIAAVEKGFVAFDRIAADTNQLRNDYERLRLSHELSREIALERDTDKLLGKILESVFKFIRADRGVIFLQNAEGNLEPRAMKRRDGSTAAISVSQSILNHVVKERESVLSHDAAMDFAASKGKSMILNRISSAMVVPLVHNNEILGVLWLDSEALAVFQPKDLELLTSVAHQAAMFIEIHTLGKKVENEIVMRERFSRLLSPNVAERVVRGQLEVKQGGQRVDECTVFNSDIRGFTTMSEGATPEQLVDMLNDYFEFMVDIVFKFEGTLDKFMGDGIMAIWGAPVTHPDDAVRSVLAALEMGQKLSEWNTKRIANGQAPLAVGIGIHTGPLVAGYIGSSKALSYTVIGDTANTSARLCGVAAAEQVIVSEATYAKLGNKFEVEELEPVKVKGKEKPLRIYNVLRAKPAVAAASPYASEATHMHEPTNVG